MGTSRDSISSFLANKDEPMFAEHSRAAVVWFPCTMVLQARRKRGREARPKLRDVGKREILFQHGWPVGRRTRLDERIEPLAFDKVGLSKQRSSDSRSQRISWCQVMRDLDLRLQDQRYPCSIRLSATVYCLTRTPYQVAHKPVR